MEILLERILIKLHFLQVQNFGVNQKKILQETNIRMSRKNRSLYKSKKKLGGNLVFITPAKPKWSTKQTYFS